MRPVRAVRDLPDTYVADSVETATLFDALVARTGAECERLDSQYGQEHGTLAIIAPNSLLARTKEAIVGNPALDAWSIDNSGTDVTKRIRVMNARDSKGLEFDSVIVVNPMGIAKEGPGDLYVAMTRATRRLAVVTDAPLPPALS